VNTLRSFQAAGVLTALDVAFAETLDRLARRLGATPTHAEAHAVGLAAALSCRAPRHGHVCVDLADLSAGIRLEEAAPSLPWPEAATLRSALAASPLIGAGGPLVLENDTLYLARYADLEARLAAAISARLAPLPVDAARMQEDIDRLWPASERSPGDAGQIAAARTALTNRFAVIAGGPGTGKTTTVVRILAMMLRQAPADGLRIALLAPTGKAAARMVESIRGSVEKGGPVTFPPAISDAIPRVATTIHRALGVRPDNPAVTRHHRENPLPHDVVVVDEASMIPLALMARLMDAIRPEARVVLLGDQHQLASVEAGAVLADVCGAPVAADDPRPMARAVARLTFSRRFGDDSGIGELARAVNRGDVAAVAALTRSDAGRADVRVIAADRPERALAALRPLCVAAYRPMVTERDPARALEAMNAFRVLCAHRRGPLGVERLNADIRAWLAAERVVRPREGVWRGLPFLVTENDNELGVYNGDTGMFLEDATLGGELRAFLPGAESGPRSLSVNRLPAWEPVFAMTIHKSQGSEVTHAVVVLPEHLSPIVTRELVYTGLTRAREHLTLVATPDILTHAITQRVTRASGLRARLWGETDAPP
jgi:exodeoxyribonuclease V alpha subunit